MGRTSILGFRDRATDPVCRDAVVQPARPHPGSERPLECKLGVHLSGRRTQLAWTLADRPDLEADYGAWVPVLEVGGQKLTLSSTYRPISQFLDVTLGRLA